MKILIALLLATTLSTEEEGKIDQLLSATGENLIVNLQEEKVYATQDPLAKQDVKEEMSEVLELEENEITELLDAPEIENQNSLEGVIEKEMAAVLKQQAEEQFAEEIQPQVEDLSLLVQRPAVTLAAPPVEEEEKELNSYEKLPITMEEKQKIAKILITMAENNVFQLLFEKRHLERLGHEINHVHPMRFLGTVFMDPRLAHCMRRIRRSGFKWDGFIDGFSERFKQEIDTNNVNAYIPGLADALQVDPQEMQTYVNKNDFEGLVIYFMENANPRH